MKKKFFSVLIWLVVKLNIYRLWSKLHQALFQRKRVEIPRYQTVSAIMNVVRQSRWRADKWWMAWDVISHPEYAYQEYLNHGSLGDCDDYAGFSSYCLRRLPRATRPTHVSILSIQWLDYHGEFCGHNVCLYRDSEANLWMISNGFSKPRKCINVDDAINYFVGEGQRIAWFRMDESLRVWDHKIGD